MIFVFLRFQYTDPLQLKVVHNSLLELTCKVSLYLALNFLVEKSINNGPASSTPLASNFGFSGQGALYGPSERHPRTLQFLQSARKRWGHRRGRGVGRAHVVPRPPPFLRPSAGPQQR